jgi:quinol monooxygenase YgiN
MNHVAWLIELTVRPGEVEALRILTEDMVGSASLEPGVVVYERFISHDHTVVHLYERYADADAAIAHLRTFKETYAEPFLALVDRTRVTVYGTPTAQLRTELDQLGATYLTPFGGSTGPLASSSAHPPKGPHPAPTG